MKKALGFLLTPVFLIVWLLLLYLFHAAQVVALNLFGPGAHRRTVDVLNFLLLHTLWILGTRVAFHCKATLPAGRPLIFLANHQNKLDISGIGWYLHRHHPIFVSKIELSRGMPSISYNLKHSGAALIDRDDPRQALAEIGRLGKLIEETRASAVIFPEGTRALTGEMAPFAPAGVKILLKKAPSALVVPVCIDGTWKLNRYGRFPMSVGERLSWTVLPAIEPAGRTPGEVVALAEASVRSELARHAGPAG
ncbi:MAG TPA: lysophospholipid acyltransferase family protein [Solimonas sp.]|nr:lysophospholipid acyltransferase family protein [Solimonas sp.]